MAGGSSDYKRGTMEVDAQAGTFDGFMGGTKYGGSAIALAVLMPTLIFGVGLSWFTALVATVIFAFVLGVALKLKGAWYGCVVAVAMLVAIVCVILSVIA